MQWKMRGWVGRIGMGTIALSWTLAGAVKAAGITDVTGAVFWVDATQIAPQADDTELTTWFDLSGNDRDATESTVTQQPNYVVDGQNGRPVVRFDGGQWLGTAPAPSMNAFTVFAVYQFDALGADRTVVAQFDYPRADREWIYFTQNGNQLLRTSSTGNTNTNDMNFGPPPTGEFLVDAVTKTGSTATLFRNGAAVSGSGDAADPIHADPTPFLIGAVGAQPDGPPVSELDGSVAEIIIYDRALSATERERVSGYLSRKWSTPAAPGLLAYEGFEYATGGIEADADLRENGGFGFSDAWVNTNNTVTFNTAESLVAPAGANLTSNGGMVSDGSNDSRARRSLDVQIDFDTDGEYYLSALMRKVDAANNDGSEFHQLLLVDGNAEKFVIGTDTSDRLTLHDIATGGAGPTILHDETYLLVAKIVTNGAGDDEYFLKAFGSGGLDDFDDVVLDEASIVWDLTFSADVTGMADALELRTGSHVIGEYDEIRIGTTWESVTGTAAIPEPASICIAGFVATAMWPRRRR